MSGYNYDNFSTDDYDFNNAAGPGVGEAAPDFELETTDGIKKQLLDFEGDFLALELGSITCPLFHTRRDGMEITREEFPQVSFAILYVREAHPGTKVAAHKSFEDKKACATRLKTEDKESRTILVDGLDGAAHQAYGSMPNAIFIIDRKGIVRFKAEWNNPSATRKALNALTTGKTPNVKSYFRPAKPAIVLETIKRAGEGSGSDFFSGLPLLIWNNLIKLNLRIHFRK